MVDKRLWQAMLSTLRLTDMLATGIRHDTKRFVASGLPFAGESRIC